MSGPRWGKYRATVTGNVDPKQMGRLQVLVPDVSATAPSTWAMPCVPLAGTNTGMLAVPPVGASVWVEFEQGDTDFPVWVGGFWNSPAELPALARAVPPGVQGITLQTSRATGLVLSDLPGPTGGILLSTASGATIAVNDTGITISNGKGASISLTGNTTDVNLGALTVM